MLFPFFPATYTWLYRSMNFILSHVSLHGDMQILLIFGAEWCCMEYVAISKPFHSCTVCITPEISKPFAEFIEPWRINSTEFQERARTLRRNPNGVLQRWKTQQHVAIFTFDTHTIWFSWEDSSLALGVRKGAKIWHFYSPDLKSKEAT